MPRHSRGIFVAFVSLLLAGPAGAAGFLLSDLSSDKTPASQLQASLDFAVSGSTLSVSVRSRTTAAAPFDIAGVFFNASADVISLTYTGARDNNSDWSFFHSGAGVTNWKFGTFDFALGAANASGQIDHGYTNLFSFGIVCRSGTICDATDFLGTRSSGGQLTALAGLRFVDGPGGDFAFGAATQSVAVPEPGTALLLALGLVGLAGARRR